MSAPGRSPGLADIAPATRPALYFAATLVVACLVWAALFRPEITAAVSVWNDSTAYSHCWLVLPVAAFLAWDRRDTLAGVVLRPAPALAAPLCIPVLLGWFASERLGIMEFRQFGALALLLLTVLAVVGWQACRAMAAPLLYLFFLVPFGAFITPVLQHVTLDLTMFFLGLADIPAVSDGFTIEVPHATFYVAEACAGLRFLIASIAFGTLYACLIYRSPGRRMAFIVASIGIPVLANGIRAFGIVALGYVLSSAEAAAADHLIYGWIFFSLVILLLIVAGLPFRQDTARPAPRSGGLGLVAAGPRPFVPAALLLLLVALGPAAASTLNGMATSGFVPAAPVLAVAGCQAGVAEVGGPAQTVTPLDCGANGVYTLTVTVLPPRTTPAASIVASRRATGELEAEDVTFTSFNPSNDDNSVRWTLVQTSEPARLTAIASWRNGAPAVGGLAGRIAQARNSLLGSDHAPVVVALSWDPHTALLSPAKGEEAVQRMQSVLAAQTGWPAAVERISRESAR